MLVKAPLSANTSREVRTESDEISDEVMSDVLNAVVARVKMIDRRHDIPYIAGYSQNGEKIYIDRHMPRSFNSKGRRVLTDRFLILHEAVEKALLDPGFGVVPNPVRETAKEWRRVGPAVIFTKNFACLRRWPSFREELG